MHKRNTFLNSKLVSTMLSVSLLLGSFAIVSSNILFSTQANAMQESEVKTRRVPTLRAKVYEQLSRAQAESDADNLEGALEILDDVKSKIGSMNAYEIATMYNFYGFIYYNEERFDETIASFEKAVEQSPIPIGFEQTALYSLAQLNMAQGNFDKVVEYLERWESLNNGTIPPKNYVLKAQALYQGKKFEEARGYIEQAIAGHEAEGYLPDENWLVLQRAIYFEMKQPAKVKEIIAKLIRLYDEPKYWVQLAGMYGELEQAEKQLATMEIAYQRGFITSANDTFNLAQLYYFSGVPYKGAALMEQAISDNVLDENLRNLRFLAQAWQSAKENEKAIPVFAKAADLSEDGILDAQLALIYFNSDQFDDAIASATKALEKGSLRSPGNTYLVLGLSLYNKRQFAEALDTLAQAEQYPATRASSRQWQQYVEKEKSNYEVLQSIEAAP